LAEGGDRLEVENLVDWKSPNTLLKAAFPFTASNPKATYDLELGTIERGNNTADHYEVPAQKWADLTDAGGAFGAAILNDSKYGWDKPADNILRLTLIHTARARAYPYQSSNDLGHHRFIYAIAGHRGDWRSGRVPARAAALNQPLVAFQTTPHGGSLGRSFSLLSLDDANGEVAVRALKKAEDGEEIVLRVQERYGRAVQTRIRFAGELKAAREINAAEEPVGTFAPSGAELAVDLKPYQPRAFALQLSPRPAAPAPLAAAPVDLSFNLDGVSTDANRADGDFDGKGQSLAGELLPQQMMLDGIPFKLGSSEPGGKNVLVPNGQVLPIPKGAYDRLYVLAAAVGGDAAWTLSIGGPVHPRRVPITVREWQGPVGQWDSRLKEYRLLREVVVPSQSPRQSWTAEAIKSDMNIEFDPATGIVTGIDRIRRGFVKREEIAWVGTHRHSPEGNQIYIPSYVFAYGVGLPPGATEVRLPSNERVRIFAITAVRGPLPVIPAGELYAVDLPEPGETRPARLGRSRPGSSSRNIQPPLP